MSTNTENTQVTQATQNTTTTLARTFNHEAAVEYLDSLPEEVVTQATKKASGHVREEKTNVKPDSPAFDIYVAMLAKRMIEQLDQSTPSPSTGKEIVLANVGKRINPFLLPKMLSKTKVINANPTASTSAPPQRKRRPPPVLQDEPVEEAEEAPTPSPQPQTKETAGERRKRHVTMRTGVASETTQGAYQRKRPVDVPDHEAQKRRDYQAIFKFKQVDSMKVFDINWLQKINFRYWSNIEDLGLTSLVNIHQNVYVDLVRRFYGNMELDKLKSKTVYSYFRTRVKGLIMKISPRVICAAFKLPEDGETYPGGMNDVQRDEAAKLLLPHIPDATWKDLKVANLGAHERVLHAIYGNNLIGKGSQKATITVEDAWCLSKIIKKEAVDFASAIVTRMIHIHQHKWTPSFGMALTLLFKYQNMELKEEKLVLIMDKVPKYGMANLAHAGFIIEGGHPESLVRGKGKAPAPSHTGFGGTFFSRGAKTFEASGPGEPSATFQNIEDKIENLRSDCHNWYEALKKNQDDILTLLRQLLEHGGVPTTGLRPDAHDRSAFSEAGGGRIRLEETEGEPLGDTVLKTADIVQGTGDQSAFNLAGTAQDSAFFLDIPSSPSHGPSNLPGPLAKVLADLRQLGESSDTADSQENKSDPAKP